MSAIIFAVTQQITMEYAGKNVFSEARGKWKCPWNLPTLVVNRYFKQRSFEQMLLEALTELLKKCNGAHFEQDDTTSKPEKATSYRQDSTWKAEKPCFSVFR